MKHVGSRVSFVDVHLKSRCIIFFARTLCALQLCGIRTCSIYIAIWIVFLDCSECNEKFEWTLIPESIRLRLRIGECIDRTWIITFTFSNVRCERYLAPKCKVALTSFDVGRDALSQPCTSLSLPIPTTTREWLLRDVGVSHANYHARP